MYAILSTSIELFMFGSLRVLEFAVAHEFHVGQINDKYQILYVWFPYLNATQLTVVHDLIRSAFCSLS